MKSNSNKYQKINIFPLNFFFFQKKKKKKKYNTKKSLVILLMYYLQYRFYLLYILKQ